MSKSTKSTLSESAIAQYDKIITAVPGVERKGAKSAYTSRNGHMFSFLTPEGPLALRLSDDEKLKFEEKHKTGPCIQHGSVMRGYVLVPESLFMKTAAMKKLFKQSYDYIGTLPAKPTKRKKVKKKTTKKNKTAASKKTSVKTTQKTTKKKSTRKKSR